MVTVTELYVKLNTLMLHRACHGEAAMHLGLWQRNSQISRPQTYGKRHPHTITAWFWGVAEGKRPQHIACRRWWSCSIWGAALCDSPETHLLCFRLSSLRVEVTMYTHMHVPEHSYCVRSSITLLLLFKYNKQPCPIDAILPPIMHLIFSASDAVRVLEERLEASSSYWVPVALATNQRVLLLIASKNGMFWREVVTSSV